MRLERPEGVATIHPASPIALSEAVVVAMVSNVSSPSLVCLLLMSPPGMRVIS